MSRLAGPGALLVGAMVSATANAEPTPTAVSAESRCVAAYTGAQESRRHGQYRQAREQLLVCGRDPCSASIKRDCATWLDQVEAITPSVVVNVRAPGGEPVIAVRVSIDGTVVTDHLDGRSIDVDPGVHVFRYDVAGRAPIQRKVLVVEGEKSRRLDELLAPLPGQETTARSEAPLWPAFVSAGVSAAALGSFAYFGIRGASDHADLDGCKGHCTSSQVDSDHDKLVAADVSLGVAVVAAGIATYFFLRHASESPPPHRLAATKTVEIITQPD